MVHGLKFLYELGGIPMVIGCVACIGILILIIRVKDKNKLLTGKVIINGGIISGNEIREIVKNENY
jgi:hypothetical protein